MPLPTRDEARHLLEHHVADDYQRYHARMVATALERYAQTFQADPELWFLTGLLHDLDFEGRSSLRVGRASSENRPRPARSIACRFPEPQPCACRVDDDTEPSHPLDGSHVFADRRAEFFRFLGRPVNIVHQHVGQPRGS